MPAGLTLQDRIAAIRAALLDLPKPSIPGSIDVDLPAVVAGDTTIRDVRMQAEPAPDGWQVKTLSASLPGRTTLEGVGAAQDRRERFRLRRLAACRRRTAVRFRRLAVQGRRRGDPPAAGCRLQGEGRSHHGAPAVQRPGTHPRQGEIPGRDRKQRAEGRQPVDAGGAQPAMRSMSTGWRRSRRCSSASAAATRFADRDLDIKVKAGPVSASGLTAETVDAALQAAWRRPRDRPAGDRRACRRDDQRHRQDQGFRRQARKAMSTLRSWRSTWRRRSTNSPRSIPPIC